MTGNERVLTIGRRPDCDIVLKDETVSGRHAELTVLGGGQVMIKDCSSANGTSLIVDGKEVPIQEQVVSSWELLRFGDYQIEVSDLMGMVPPEPAPPPPVPPLPELHIRKRLGMARHYEPAPFERVPELASRESRLVAAIFDALLGMSVSLPIGGGQTMGSLALVVIGVLLALTLSVIQIVLLAEQGQTLGKKLTGVRIVKMNTGQNGGFVTNFVLRVLPLALVPPVALVDPFFIFREDRRCLHDLIADTEVVKVKLTGVTQP